MHEAHAALVSIYDVFNCSAPHTLPALPYELDALEPVISASTLEQHHGEHHKAHVDALNRLVQGTRFAEMTLGEIIRATAGKRAAAPVFNHAAQLWNHTFYWHSLRPPHGGSAPIDLTERINATFGGMEGLKQALVARAAHQTSSCWLWLVVDAGALKVAAMGYDDHPIRRGCKPLFAIDAWQHAYHADYEGRRADYIGALFEHLINWRFAAENFA
jgi:Fe-Mn family superoxide dismutase